MKALQLIVAGDWAHFKKPETNNNPLSHDLITKTALIGMVGAVLGIERLDMKAKFPEFSNNFLYNVQLLSPVKKISWGFTSRTAISPTKAGTPKYFEFLKKPKFKITLALKDDHSQAEFDKFYSSIKNKESSYTPVLGWHNCPAELEFLSFGEVTIKKAGKFETAGFVSTEHKPEIDAEFRIGFDKLPTFQNNDFWNLPERYQEIIYPDFPHTLKVQGDFFEYKDEQDVTENLWLM